MLRHSLTLPPPIKMERRTTGTRRSVLSVATETETILVTEIETENAVTAAVTDDEIEMATMT